MNSGAKDYRQRRRIVLKSSTLSKKASICPRAPNPRLPSIAFKEDLFITDYPEEQARIEQYSLHGADIFRWRLEP